MIGRHARHGAEALAKEAAKPDMRGASGLLYDATPKGREELAAIRAESDESTRVLRLLAVADALEACGLDPQPFLRSGGQFLFNEARTEVQALRRSLYDGSDEPRYLATERALEALGELWSVS